MQLVDFDPQRHTPETLALWSQVFADHYPVTERVFLGCTVWRPSWDPGDAVLATDAGVAVGFGMIEVDRPAANGSVAAIAVHPAHQRRGLGERILAELERRLVAAGCASAQVGGALHRFWTGVPEDLPTAKAFFEKQGYELNSECYDLVIPPEAGVDAADWRRRMAAAEVELVSASSDDLGPLLSFQMREFPGWTPSMLRMLAGGDMANVLVLRRGAEIVGTVQSFTPRSRWRAANLVWECLLGEDLGGYGSVGIAKDLRGQGLGRLLCEGADVHVRSEGAANCHIDWTGLIDFYGKFGARPWRKFFRGNKQFQP